MRPIVLKGHERPLTQLKYNREGDILFSTARDKVVCVWYAHNGERLGTYNGHNGALMTVDVDQTTTVAISGAADLKINLWKVETGETIHVWEGKASIKRVEFSPDNKSFLAVSEEHMGQRGAIRIYPVTTDGSKPETSEPLVEIINPQGESKVTFATWVYDGKHIVAGHGDGSVSLYNAETGEKIKTVDGHEDIITDIQASPDRTYFITASKDRKAKLFTCDDLTNLKTYNSDAPMNTAAITPVKDFVILGGGQEAKDVTTTSSREGKFQSRFYHKLFEDELGNVKGHFGPINTVVVHPKGTSFASGSEDGYIRVHHFDKHYFDFMYDIERRG
ncbi:eukaryotic translation initiation factor 3 subunit I [Trichomonascus vanleenenianus]|uniref:translation initiation factor eIF3 subunit i n=1 Tax=Trichomonascus vanleenenianus TaxID=2268995 RepID=UPI003EC995BB